MKRNIVKQGPSTLMVSLPSKWVNKYNLKKGEQVDIEEKGRNLMISTDSDKETKSKTIKLLDNYYYYVWRELAAAYVSGYDEIKVYYSDLKTYEFIEQSVVNQIFIGFDIIEQTNEYCIIKKISKEDTSEFNTIMRRIFITLLEASKTFQEVLNGKSNGELLFHLERTNNRHCYFLKRLISSEGFEKEDKSSFASTLVFLLEQLMNQYKYSLWYIEKEKIKKFPKSIQDTYSKIHIQIELLYKLYFSYSKETFEKLERRTIKVDSRRGETMDLLKESPFIAHFLINMIEKIHYSSYQIHGINA